MEELNLVNFAVLAFLIVIAPYIGRLFKIPIIVSEMVLGALAFYSGILKNSHELEILAQIGFLYLMFLAGMEVDLRGFLQLGKRFYKRAFFYFVLLYGFATVIVVVLNLPFLYIATFPVMSVGVIITLIRTYGKDNEWLNIALKIGIVGELVSIVALVIVNGVYSYGLTSLSLYKTLGILIGFIVVIAVLFRVGKIAIWWKPKLRLWFMPPSDSNSQDIRFSMMLFFVLIMVVGLLSLELVLGAFLAGMIVATFFAYKTDMIHKLNDVGFGFFVPAFFIHVGSTLDLTKVFADYSVLVHGILIILGMLAIRMLSATIVFKSYFKSVKNTMLYAFSDCMPLTFLVATASLGYSLEAIDEKTYYAFIIAAILEGILFNMAIKFIYNFKSHKIKQDKP
ncbi:sodium:proton antiporter [Helicobacter sp. 13S00401-1]|uniref:cation:proton antiporter n=1 Tax=Helicobacter sp. 13S00401-1 TaxID=1905758 RepID=UPI000BA76320|nr:cation:proton antiporter [Helicobacter sp. 13S00401-1]PAF50211.1 sodium:proton antiporter [Helicobacter sp. 13S00401-1]